MPVYTDAATVTAYLAASDGGVTLPAGALGDALIDRAEQDVDSLFGPWQMQAGTGRKIAPAKLTADERTALARCVACQVEHRLVAGEDAIRLGRETGTPLSSIEGPDFKKQFAVSVVRQPVRRYSPRMKIEIEPIGHLRILGARATP